MNMNNFIGFYHEYDEYGCFSNWYHAEFDYAGVHFKNSEQFMMYHKLLMFGKYHMAETVMKTDNPAECKKIAGQKFPEFVPEIWEKTCYTIVKRGVKAKFSQNEDILKTLLETGTSLLAECSPYDEKWGIGIDISDPARLDTKMWKGRNLLGGILMEVREELKQELILSSDGKLKYVEAKFLDPVEEWNRTAGELKRIPQFCNAIHAYSDTLENTHLQDCFYYTRSLHDWETEMWTNKNCVLHAAGFFEMKQEVYEIAQRLRNYDR